MQPLRIEQVNLAGVLAQRRKTSGVPRNIKRPPDAFIGVEFYLRRGHASTAVASAHKLLAPFYGFLLLSLL